MADALRYIVLAGSKASGRMEAENVNISIAAIVTPRSKQAARGVLADRIFEATSLRIEDRDELMELALPSLMMASD